MLKQLNFAASLTCLVLGLLVAPLSAPIFGNVAHAQQVQKMQIEQLRTQARAAFRNNNPEQALRLSEQLLIANPRDLQARFLRATILVSLGRGAQIRNEVALMARLNLSPKDKNRAQALLAAIDKQNKNLALAADFSIGYGQTDNANSWPKTGEYTFANGEPGDLPDPTYNEKTELDDSFYNVKFGLSGSYHIGQRRKNAVRFGVSQSEQAGSDTDNLDSALTQFNVSFETMLPYMVQAQLGLRVRDDDRTNHRNNDENVQAVVGTDREKTSVDFQLARKFGVAMAGLRLSQIETDASGVKNADLSDATVDANNIFVGMPIGRTNYVRFALGASEQRSNYSGNNARAVESSDSDEEGGRPPVSLAELRERDMALSRYRVDKDTDNYTFLFVKSVGSYQRFIFSYTKSESDFKENLVGKAIKRQDELELISARYAIDVGKFWQNLSGYRLELDMTQLDSSSNQAAANVSALTYRVSLSRKFNLFN